MGFPGGSAWAMARDVAEGYCLVTERTYQRLLSSELDKLAFEFDRLLREMRGEQPPLDDIPALQARNRRIGRVNSALTILRSYRLAKKV